MNKKHSKKTKIRLGARILSVLLSALLIMNTAVFAYTDKEELPRMDRWPVSPSLNSEKTISENTGNAEKKTAEEPLKVKAVGFNDPQGTALTELVLTDLDEPETDRLYDTVATVTSHEKFSWEIPVYWIDSNGKPVDQPKKGSECLPVIVFFVPDGYQTDGLLELTPYLSDVFRNAGGVLTIVDQELGITYITAASKDFAAPKNAATEASGRTGGSVSPENADPEEIPAQSADSGKTEEPDMPEAEPSDEKEEAEPSDDIEDPAEPGEEPKEPIEPVEEPSDEPEEPDPYVVFAEKYREDGYENIPWIEELEALGGMDEVDFLRLVKACGYIETTALIRSISGTYDDWQQEFELEMSIRQARYDFAEELYEQADPYLRAHVSDKDMVAKSDQESLLRFVHQIIDNIIPQAVQLLKDNFPAFSAADNENFSRELGVQIRYPQSNGAAYVDNSYENSDDYYIRLTVCLNAFVEDQRQDPEYTFDLADDSSMIPYLKQTMLHEVMHIFMTDYNRAGESFYINLPKTEDGNLIFPGIGEVTRTQAEDLADTLMNPTWFAEGTASLCGTVFSTYDNYYDTLRNEDETYSASGLYEFGKRRRLTLDMTNPYYWRNDMYNNYIIAPLAVMYLGELSNQKTTGESTVLLDTDGNVSVDTIAVRNGISDILERMHNGETMDSIIADISGGKYFDTQDFCEKYYELDGPNMDTLGFAADVLNYVDALSREKGSTVNASILLPFDEDILDLIDISRPTSTDIYVIQDVPDYVKSTVSDEITGKTAGKSDPYSVLDNGEEQNTDTDLYGNGNAPAAEAGTAADSETAAKQETAAKAETSVEADTPAKADTSVEAETAAKAENPTDSEADEQGIISEASDSSAVDGAEAVSSTVDGEATPFEQAGNAVSAEQFIEEAPVEDVTEEAA